MTKSADSLDSRGLKSGRRSEIAGLVSFFFHRVASAVLLNVHRSCLRSLLSINGIFDNVENLGKHTARTLLVVQPFLSGFKQDPMTGPALI